MIHDTYYSIHGDKNSENDTINYEKLEVLGDAVLDAIINSTLASYAMDRKISPYEIHHSKSNLVNNELLCKIATFYGIHKFILSGYSKYNISEELLQTLYDQHEECIKNDKYPRSFFEEIKDRKQTFWDHKNGNKKKKKNRARRKKNKGNYII